MQDETIFYPPHKDPFRLEKGDRIKGRYELLEKLGSGAMGVVWRARDHNFSEKVGQVALKIMPPTTDDMRDTMLAGLRNEAEVARPLSHPNIVKLLDYDYDEDRGMPFLVMDFVDGKSILTQMPLPETMLVEVAMQICDGLDYLHQAGVLHRDLKPGNIMLTESGTAKICDFGLSRVMQQAFGHLSMAGEISGTPTYMSPEQCKGGKVDARSDVYSLGCVFYAMLAGQPPFTEGDLSYQHVWVKPRMPAKGSRGLEKIVARCLEKEPDHRFQSVADLKKAIHNLCTDSEAHGAGFIATKPVLCGAGYGLLFGVLVWLFFGIPLEIWGASVLRMLPFPLVWWVFGLAGGVAGGVSALMFPFFGDRNFWAGTIPGAMAGLCWGMLPAGFPWVVQLEAASALPLSGLLVSFALFTGWVIGDFGGAQTRLGSVIKVGCGVGCMAGLCWMLPNIGLEHLIISPMFILAAVVSFMVPGMLVKF